MSTVMDRDASAATGKAFYATPTGLAPGAAGVSRLRKPPLGIMESLHQRLHEARQELEGLDRMHKDRIREEARQAEDLLYRQAVDRFERDHRRWSRNPDLFQVCLGATWLGAMFFSNIWRKMAEALRPDGPGLSLEIIFQTMMASGSPWKVQQTNPAGWWLATRCLAQFENSEAQVEQWIKRSRDTDTASHLKRVCHYRENAPAAGEALEELRRRADEMVAFWDNQAKKLETEFYDQVRFFRENAAGTGLGDRRMMADARVFMALRKSARDHVARLEKRIAELKKERRKDREKQSRQLERQFMRLDKSLFSIDLPETRAEAAEPDQEPEIEPGPPLRRNPLAASLAKPMSHELSPKPKEPDMTTAETRLTERPTKTSRPQRPEKDVREMLVKHHLPASIVKRPRKLFPKG